MTEINQTDLDRIITAIERLADAADAIASLLAAPAALAATGPRLTGVPVDRLPRVSDIVRDKHDENPSTNTAKVTGISGAFIDILWRHSGSAGHWPAVDFEVIE